VLIKQNLLLFLLLLVLGACKYTRHLTAEDKLLWENEIVRSDGQKAGYEAGRILKQQPNAHFGFVSPNLFFYNLGNGKDSSFTTKVGAKPVLHQAAQSNRSAVQLENYYFNKGYFYADVKYEIVPVGRTKAQKVKVRYDVKLGPRYQVDSVSHQIASSHIQGLVNYFSSRSLLKAGEPFDADRMEKEREWITEMLHNHGYYGFQKNNIRYLLDTLQADKSHRIWLTLVIDNPRPAKGQAPQNHRRYKVAEVQIRPDYNYAQPPLGRHTLEHQGYLYRYDTLAYRPRYITDAIHFEPGDYYKKRTTDETYQHLSSYDGFSITEITYQPLEQDSAEGRLRANIKLVPLKKRSLRLETEGTATSGNYGINGASTIINRNIFRGGEALNLGVRAGLEWQPAFGGSNFVSRTVEFGASLGLDIPRFWLPFNTENRFPKRIIPTTQLQLELVNTRRVEFNRFSTNVFLRYRWKALGHQSHQLDLINLGFSDLEVDQNSDFFQALDPVQQLSFQSELVSSIRYTFTVNKPRVNRSRLFYQLKGETAGNLANLAVNNSEIGGARDISIGDFRLGNEVNALFGVPLFQYFRAEGEVRHFFNFDDKHVWANRLYAGYLHAYGNSAQESELGKIRIPPFSRYFSLGGANDLRSWPAFRVGGGTDAVTDYAEGNNGFALGTVKFLAGTEYRFPIVSALEGAFFVDAANIWLSGGLNRENPETGFAIERFLHELYVGGGTGVRFDFEYFIIRFDVGIKLRDPGFLPEGDPWVWERIAPRNFTYNFALGYPF